MEILLRSIGSFGGNPAKLIEITVELCGSKISGEVTELSGKVPESLIDNLRQVANELEEQNNKLKD